MIIAPSSCASAVNAFLGPVGGAAHPRTRATGPMLPAAGPAAPTAPAGPAGALDGAARLTSSPIVDFPGVAVGQEFDIVKGSKVGRLGGVTGDAEILSFGPDLAAFQLSAGKFGFRVDVEVSVERIDDTHVRISSRGKGIPDQDAIGEIVHSRRNYAEFRAVDMDLKNTIIRRDAATGRIVIDTEVPNFGDAHLVLDPKRQAARGAALLG